MATIAVSNDYIEKLSKRKMTDKESESPKLFRLKNLMCWDPFTDEQKELAKQADLTLYTIDEVI